MANVTVILDTAFVDEPQEFAEIIDRMPAGLRQKPIEDLLLVDGSHEKEAANADLNNCYPLLRLFGTLIWDDIQCPQLNEIIEHNKRNGAIREHRVYPTSLYPHKVLFKPIGIPPEGHNCSGHPMRIFANQSPHPQHR